MRFPVRTESFVDLAPSMLPHVPLSEVFSVMDCIQDKLQEVFPPEQDVELSKAMARWWVQGGVCGGEGCV